ncbi:MAG TPA: tail fiber domain-containing protein [Bacteroidales bacterium]|nr:tail fiber domain-containing protein [Bacteroidales bacterium]HSA42857.1 tail fiber domain-containing protein [Bacteroidales bacterium]
MKKAIITLANLLIVTAVWAQSAQQYISYQAVIRNAGNALVTNQGIGMQLSILQGAPGGTAVYVERHFPNTNANGLVSVEIGSGIMVSGNYAGIDWAGGPYFLKTETDPNGGANYSITGTSQLLSVPYALYAITADSLAGGVIETDPLWLASPSSGISGTDLANWNTAFGWGNHAAAGYAPAVHTHAAADVSSGILDIARIPTGTTSATVSLGNHTHSQYLSTEADPTWNGNANATAPIWRQGDVGIGILGPPDAMLHAVGNGIGGGNVLFVGEYLSSNPGNPPATGAGTRMMWYPNKGAFRVGYVNGTHWNKDSIGLCSVAMGYNTKARAGYSTAMGNGTKASGNSSTALGEGTTASGYGATAMGINSYAIGNVSTAMGYGTAAEEMYSTAMGSYTTASAYTSTALGGGTVASGDYSTTMGYHTTASGYYSAAFGYYTTASGHCSKAMGSYTVAPSYVEVVIGRHNMAYTPGSSTGWNSSDRLFVIGNGTSSTAQSNAMTVLKNGRVGLQTVTTPTFALELPNSSTDGVGKGRANAWTTYSDARVKSGMQPIAYGLKEIMRLKPVRYFHHDSRTEAGVLQILESGAPGVGFAAQEVYPIIPEIVSVPEDENSALWGLSYDKLTPVLVKAIQEQQEIIDAQRTDIDQLRSELEALKHIFEQQVQSAAR